ncbi:hypothetical protein ACHAWF_012086 [Thalassiosira exigua]
MLDEPTDAVNKAGDASREVLNDLRDLYMNKILPVEQLCQFKRMGGQSLDHASFNAPPILMLIGPYSSGKRQTHQTVLDLWRICFSILQILVGKTSFIHHLVGKQFPGERVGPEPTTDKFIAIYKADDDERVVPGNALTVTPNTPFSGLEKFGNGFLTRQVIQGLPYLCFEFEGSQVVGSPILEDLIIIDTPGVLSGEKQRLGRSYDYQAVMEWFAERADMILVMMDVQKLDISDEMDIAIKSLSKHYDKVRVVLNKADSVSHQNLIKVYGALMWSLGRVITTPEVTKVYIGSFWDAPLKNEETKALMEKEMRELVEVDLAALPRLGAVRKINDMVKRIRQVRVLVLLLDHIRQSMGSKFFGKDKKKKELIGNLPAVFREVMKRHDLSPGDFPDIKQFQAFLQESDINTFPKVNGKKMDKGQKIEDLRVALKVAMPDLLNRLPGIASTKVGIDLDMC